MVQIVNLQPAPTFGQLLGQGISQGMEDIHQMSMNQKMQALKDQKQAEFQQQQVSKYAQNLRKLGGDFVPFANVFEATGGDAKTALSLMEQGYTNQNPSDILNQNFSEGANQYSNGIKEKNALFEPQFREAEYEEKKPEISSKKISSELNEELPPIEDIARDINPRFDQMKGNARKKVLEEAQIRSDSLYKRLKTEREERNYHTKIADKAAEDFIARKEKVRTKEGALQLANEAIETGETGPFSWANISKRLDIPELMNAAGTQLTQAGKDLFFGNMMRVSAKAQNQWLEQRITRLAAEVGDPEINALMKNTMLQSELDLDKAYINSYEKIAKEDMDNFGYVRKDIQERAYKDSEAAAQEIMKRTSFQTRELYEREKGTDKLLEETEKRVPKGTYLTPLMANVFATKTKEGDYQSILKRARALGYKIPTKEEMEIWQK